VRTILPVLTRYKENFPVCRRRKPRWSPRSAGLWTSG